MRITYSQVEPEFRDPVEKECERRAEKLRRWLKRYEPDLVQLHVSLEKIPRRPGYSLTLNLTLPMGTLHATGSAPDPRASVKVAFAELESQLKKHQEKLRKDYVWKRKRSRGTMKPGSVLSAD